jgi:hypothetical protein
MKTVFLLMVTIGIMLSGVLSLPAWAYIIDTGPATPPYASTIVINSAQFLAGEFALGEPVAVGSIEFWIESGLAGQFRVAIYGDDAGGNFPGEVPGTMLYSQVFSLGSTFTTQWQGTSGLNWSLNPGTYWVSIEAPSSGAGEGGSPFPLEELGGKKPPLPLSNEAAWISANNSWSEYDTLDMGVRIGAVPSPSSAILVGTGLACLLARRSFRLRWPVNSRGNVS